MWLCQGTHTDKTRAKLQSKGQLKSVSKQMVGLMEPTLFMRCAKPSDAGFINQGRKEATWAGGSGRPRGSVWRRTQGALLSSSFSSLRGLPSA